MAGNIKKMAKDIVMEDQTEEVSDEKMHDAD